MDKFVQILSKQKPNFSVKCQNSQCGEVSSVETEIFFSEDTYSFTCPFCNQKTSITNINDQLDRLKKQFKAMGIKW